MPGSAPVSVPGRRGRLLRSRGLLPMIAAVAIVGACGTAKDPPANAAAGAQSQRGCERTVLATVRTVAQRVYREIASGRITAQAVHRLTGSQDLIRAVERGDGKAALRVLHRLNEGQFVNARVIRRGHLLAQIQGAEAALAPVERPLKNSKGRTVGKFILSHEGDLDYSRDVTTLTGARMIMKVGGKELTGPTQASPTGGGLVTYARGTYRPVAMRLAAYPSGSIEATLLVPTRLLKPCSSSRGGLSTAEITAETFGDVAQRIYHEELEGAKTKEVVKRLEDSPKLERAVTDESRQQIRAVILEYFASGLHVVRMRAYKGAKMIYDLGGPHVIAPARGDIRNSAGQILGHFLVSVQDDEGYRILLNTFTGAQVLLHMGSQLVQSTLPKDSAKLRLPAHGLGQVSYHGSRYEVYSFVGKAFPSGPLYISLLVPE